MTLALELGEVNVNAMLRRVSSLEMTEWMAFLKLKADRDREAVKRAREEQDMDVIDPRA